MVVIAACADDDGNGARAGRRAEIIGRAVWSAQGAHAVDLEELLPKESELSEM